LLGSQFIHELARNREALELVAHLNPTYPTNTMKPRGASHSAERRQNKFDLDFDSQRRSSCREYKHSALANVYAVAGVVMVHAVGPAE